jgi:hypothetical protein
LGEILENLVELLGVRLLGISERVQLTEMFETFFDEILLLIFT